jgi:IS5 family transposase
MGIVLRVYFLQQWFNLSDPGVEEAIYESPALRRFAGVDLGRAPAPDETTVLRFHHLLEEHELCGRILDTVNLYLESKSIRIGTRTIVDATIIHAPSSTKNSSGERDPEMHQTRKGQQWYFRCQGAHRCGCQRGSRAFGVYFRSQCVRRAYVA